jgi:hypothetical protein
MIEKRTQKKFHNASMIRAAARSLHTVIEARARERAARPSMHILDALT